KKIASRTGLNIIAGAGYYVDKAQPKDMAKRAVSEIADEIIRDVAQGIGASGVRAGIIGEIGNSHPWVENEKKVVRADEIDRQETGASVSIHPGRNPES